MSAMGYKGVDEDRGFIAKAAEGDTFCARWSRWVSQAMLTRRKAARKRQVPQRRAPPQSRSRTAEVAEGKIAQQRSASPQVKDLGARMVRDHTDQRQVAANCRR